MYPRHIMSPDLVDILTGVVCSLYSRLSIYPNEFCKEGVVIPIKCPDTNLELLPRADGLYLDYLGEPVCNLHNKMSDGFNTEYVGTHVKLFNHSNLDYGALENSLSDISVGIPELEMTQFNNLIELKFNKKNVGMLREVLSKALSTYMAPIITPAFYEQVPT
jgi:hypothetical protein